MINQFDLNTIQKTLTGTAAGTDLGISSVPAGKQRFVTYVKVYCPTHENVVSLGEATAATGVLATTKLKHKVVSEFKYPETPNKDNPLFSIAAEKYLGVIGLSSIADTELTLQYYDA